MDNTQRVNKLGVMNPMIALGFVIATSCIMVLVTILLFVNSNAYKTVKQIQSGSKASSKSDLSGYDTKSPVKPYDIDQFADKLNNKLSPINNENDYSENIKN